MDFKKVFDEIKSGVKDLVENAIKTFKDEATEDLQTFLTTSRADLKRLSEALARGELTGEEFEFLIGTKATNAKMLALSSKGIARARIKRLQESLRDLIIRSVTAAI